MQQSDLITQFKYGYWARDRVLASVESLAPEQLTLAEPISYGSLSGLLTHMLNVEYLWRLRCQKGESPQGVKYPNAIVNLEQLRQDWQTEERLMLAYVETLTEEQLDKQIKYLGISGRPFENRLMDILTQFILHGTHHRAEVATKLAELGETVGDIDFIIYLSRK